MGIAGLLRKARTEFKQKRVERLEAKKGDLETRLELAQREKKALLERKKLREMEKENRALRAEPRQAALGQGKKAIEAIANLGKKFGHESTSPFSQKQAAPLGSDKTRAVLGMNNGRNPFYPEEKKVQKGGKTVVIKVQ